MAGYPRTPPRYSYDTANAAPALVASIVVPTNCIWPLELAIRVATALTTCKHAGEDDYLVGVVGGIIEGTVGGTVGEMMDQVGRRKDGEGTVKVMLECIECESWGLLEQGTPLHVLARNAGTTLDLSLHYDSSLLPRLEATWFLSHLTTAITILLSSDPASPVSSISFLGPDEQSTLSTLARSDHPRPSPSDLTDLPSYFLVAASLYPDDVALEFDTTAISYRTLLHLAKWFAHHLLSVAHLKPGQIIPLCIDKSVEMIVALLGIQLVGCGYLNFEPSLPVTRREGILDELRAEGLLGPIILQGSEGSPSSFLASIDPVVVLTPLLPSLDTVETNFPLPTSTQLPTPIPTNPAYIIYTSGSTGTPKGIIVEHRNVAAFLRNYAGVFGRKRGERVLQFPSFAFDVFVMNVWGTFAEGATLCMTSSTSLLSDLAGSVLRLNCTLVDLTPTVSTLLLEHPAAQPLPHESIQQAWIRAGFAIKVLSTGGERVERWVRDAWMERGVKVVIDYGPSETTVGVISNQSLEGSAEVVPIGRPTGRNVIYVLDDALEQVPLGCIGEICVAGEQVTRGYVRKSLNEGVFVEHEKLGRIYRTGDLGRFLGDGEGSIECLGRRDGQVKINGLRIEVGEIERHLTSSTHEALHHGVVDKIESETMPPSLVAFIVLSPNSPLLFDISPFTSVAIQPFFNSPSFHQIVDEIRSKMAESLPSYMVPRYWLPITRIPTQGMGKTDRKSLRLLAQSHNFSRGSTKQSTQDEWHDAVRDAWGQVLKGEEGGMGDEDEFTKLGGDSIGFLRVIGLLRTAGYSVSFSDLISASSLSDCARVLRASPTQSQQPPTADYVPFSLLDPLTLPSILAELSTDFSILSTDIIDVYPTSPSQDSLLAASLESTHYYAQAVYALDDSIGLGTIERALGRLVARHEVLRTCFVVLDATERTLQVVLSSDNEQVKACVTVERVEVEEGESQVCIDAWLDRDRAKHVFQWGRLSLSFAIFVGSDGTSRLAWCMHHAMSDGWTLELLTTDLQALCHSLPLESRPPFAQVVSWWSSRPAIPSSSESFWKPYLLDSKPLNWPTLAPLAGLPLSTSSEKSLHWNGSLSSFSKTHGITPAIASRVAISLALSQYSGSTDITVGIVRSGRDIDLPSASTIIGPIVSVLPSRLLLPPTTSLLSLLIHESSMDLQSRSHQLVTLPELARMGGYETRSAMFDILITYQSLTPRPPSSYAYPILQPPMQIRMPTSYTLSFEVTPTRQEDGGIEIACFFDHRVIGGDEVEGLLNTVGQVLEYIVRAPCTILEEMELGGQGVQKGEAVEREEGRKEGVVDEGVMRRVAEVWAGVLRMEVDDVLSSRDLTFSSLGGDSISMMRISVRLSRASLSIPISQLSTLPTLHSQALYLSRSDRTA